MADNWTDQAMGSSMRVAFIAGNEVLSPCAFSIVYIITIHCVALNKWLFQTHTWVIKKLFHSGLCKFTQHYRTLFWIDALSTYSTYMAKSSVRMVCATFVDEYGSDSVTTHNEPWIITLFTFVLSSFLPHVGQYQHWCSDHVSGGEHPG